MTNKKPSLFHLLQSLTPDEQRLFRLYGKLPSKSDHFAKHLKERKYFDSGDYAMSKAGKGDKLDTGSVGSQHPVPENIPHLSSSGQATGLNGGPGHQHHHSASGTPIGVGGAAVPAGVGGVAGSSPVKESSLFKSESSMSEDVETNNEKDNAPVSTAEATGIPIRK